MGRTAAAILITLAIIATIQPRLEARLDIHSGATGVNLELRSGKSS